MVNLAPAWLVAARDKFLSRLVPDARNWWRWGTMRLHALAIVAATFVYENPTAVPDLLQQLPSAYRHFLPPVVLGVWALLVPLVRLWKGQQRG